EVHENIVECRRLSSESCKFSVAWPVTGFGRPIVTTASLPEREQPYLLSVELARGKIVQVRNQASQWELAGMILPPDYVESSRQAHRQFSKAASNQDQPDLACQFAAEALHYAFAAAEQLTLSYSKQTLNTRMQRFAGLPSLIGCELQGSLPHSDADELFSAAFNLACVSVPWQSIEKAEGKYDWGPSDRQIDWCEQQKLLVRGGPLISFGPGGLPSWLARWEHDIFNLQSFVCDFVETAVARYVGRIRIWEIASHISTGGALSLTEETRLTLAARILDVARQVDEEAQLLIRIDQPWGDYQVRGQHRLSAMQLVDALIRSGIGLAGVNLELAMGYLPRGSAHRDLMEISRLIDNWSILGVPLHAMLAFPSSSQDDDLAGAEWEVEPRMWANPCDVQGQALWIDRVLELLLAKPSIASVTMSHFSDATPHQFPQAGLLDNADSPKPSLEHIIEHRQRHKRRD
ncbi:MAG: glycoside hydrolase, partial [Planctomycetes bacterium]|nr:glycoside hydrolase [Planctomycetota bacterium]